MSAVPVSHPLTLDALGVGVLSRALLWDVTLTLGRGERVALTGPSGAGKTTLLRAVSGLIDPLAGSVRLGGQSPHDVGFPRWRRHVTYVAQAPIMLSGTVRENLARPFRYARVDATYREETVCSLLERVGLGPARLEQGARSLSQGEQQRVALVRAMAIDPRVLLLDEPTSALDADSVASMESLISEWTERGGAALVVTHDATQAARLCHRVVDLSPHAAPEDRSLVDEL